DDRYFLNQGRKIWYHCFVEADSFELHLDYKAQFPGYVWLQPEKDGTATIVGIHVREGFRNTGLGTVMFQEAVKQVRDRVTCIKGVLEKEYYPEPEDSFRWLHRQGFEIKEKENGDYEVELWLR
ncbi:MAG: GNAT family N-acetyltransferase, partial [Anaerolineales bacterium]|nr:GNAT family N-acetyltransferase [Anaerolineales bacterium]